MTWATASGAQIFRGFCDVGALSNQRQHRRAIKMIRMRVGHEQVIGAFQRGGVFAFCSKVAGVKNEGAPLILKADT